jgi:hypothetical protein
LSAGERLEQYLTDVRRRLRAVVVARASAVVALTALAVTVVAVVVLRNPGFPASAVLTARLTLFGALLVAAGAMLWRPLLALTPRHRTRTLERHLPAQGGRIETWHELMRRREQGHDAPLADLLAEDALTIADREPATEVVPPRRTFVPAALGGAAVLLLALMLAFGPSEWGFGSRNLWFGTPIPKEQLALRQIGVTPGNATVRRNQDVPIRATPTGFNSSDAQVYVRFGEGKTWERAPMRAAKDGSFEFTVYALREPLKYYVSAQGVKSAEHLISVTDVPRIERMRLTYTYPSWTGLKPETDDVSRDIRAVAGTKVSVELQTSAPLESPTLTVNNASSGLKQEGTWSRGVIDVSKEGRYRVSARVGDEVVPLTDEHDITVVEDQPPTVEFAKPGRDWRANSIEEVRVQVHARDDFRVDDIDLHYSVNGGAWGEMPLKKNGKDVSAQVLFKLEEMGAKETSPTGEPRLTPGDIITYYAVAKDHRQSAKTDLFLIHVQPFERRFTQGQAGGGGGGGGDEQENVISQRQREILLATWNLQRTQERKTGREAERVEENAHMLSEAQGTLAEQAQTLIARAQARGVDNVGEKNRELLDNLEQAVKAMQPAAKHLNDIALNDAIPQEQKALQHLLRAEALYSDIEVQFRQSAGGGGGGGNAGRDLAEMFELEMDLDKNQYETESRAAGKEETPQQLADALRKLRELAQRQERLAREAARQQQGPRESERWKQEQLRRETEDLRKRLEELAQQNSNSNSQQGQGQGQSQSQGQQGGRAQSGGGQSASASTAAEALDQVQQALKSMQGAGGEPQNQQGQSGEQSREQQLANARAAQQASRDLKQALERLERGRREGMAGEFDDLAARAQELTEEQRKQQEELLNAFSQQRDAAGNPQSGAGPGRSRGLSWERAEALAEQKRALQSELESLQRDMQAAAQGHREDAPDAANRVGKAAKDVAESNLSAGITRSALELERGRGVQAAARERLITEALENLENDLSQAARVAANEARQQKSQKNEATPEELLAELSDLRRAWQLAQAGQQGRNGQRGGFDPNAPRDANGRPDPNGRGTDPNAQNPNGQNQNGQNQKGQPGGPSQQSGQSGGNQSGGDQAGSAQDGGAGSPNGGNYANNRGGAWGGPWGGNNWRGGYAPWYDRGPLGTWNPPLATNALRPGESLEFNQQAEEIGRRLRGLLDRMPQNSLTAADLAALRQLSNNLRRGERDRMESEYPRMLGLVDQLELAALNASEKNRDNAATRTANPTAESPEYRETVAEYYRRLGGAPNK